VNNDDAALIAELRRRGGLNPSHVRWLHPRAYLRLLALADEAISSRVELSRMGADLARSRVAVDGKWEELESLRRVRDAALPFKKVLLSVALVNPKVVVLLTNLRAALDAKQVKG
jgi:hypothetical protein